MSAASPRLVAGGTFVLLGVLVLLEAAGAFALPASLLLALLLLGLGAALILRR